MMRREAFLEAVSKENVEDFLHFMQLSVSRVMRREPQKHKFLWNKWYSIKDKATQLVLQLDVRLHS